MDVLVIERGLRLPREEQNGSPRALFLDRRYVTFAKTLTVNDWYLGGGGGYPLGSLQLIGKVQGIMMKSWASRVPLAVLNRLARRSVEWLVMAEDGSFFPSSAAMNPALTIAAQALRVVAESSLAD